MPLAQVISNQTTRPAGGHLTTARKILAALRVSRVLAEVFFCSLASRSHCVLQRSMILGDPVAVFVQPSIQIFGENHCCYLFRSY
ncbi:MAG: hypothetical protein Q7U13_04295 [Rhodoferax sp.]|nr:hypothetical protein [Rhodoferax sp.]